MLAHVAVAAIYTDAVCKDSVFHHLQYPVSSPQPGVEHDTLLFLYACSCVAGASKGSCVAAIACNVQGKVRREE